MIIWLAGSMNAGKSTLGRRLVQRLGRSVLIELDDQIQRGPGVSFAEVVAVAVGDACRAARRWHQRGVTPVCCWPLSASQAAIVRRACADTGLLLVTLRPGIEVCLRDRGNRILDEGERERIRAMHLAEDLTDPHGGRELDTAVLDPDACVDRILAWLPATAEPPRPLLASDIPRIQATPGWRRSPDMLPRRLAQQDAGEIVMLVAWDGDRYLGHGILCWRPAHAAFLQSEIPEIQDLDVHPTARRRGVASLLMDHLENLAANRSPVVGLAVGLHPGYTAAQRLYIRRGYVPTAEAPFAHDAPVREGQQVAFDDELVRHFTKDLRDCP